ncbi:hypothetical protein BV25DRAFT_1809277 [Artomyces pyxidatus]|uniref:Uncharacterized protein n=1 Tax=Artomyces pyxidatus TaxID=48021 RepID=A0ACB8SUF5_9AGAM|nr:hypothetical protein BV25DRAFT_1809277 [Artomyces pyxidatus]
MLPGRSLVRHYASLAEEQDYWDSAARWKRYLAASDDRLGGLNPPLGRHLTNIPLIMSYVPRLLPTYRESVIADDEESEYELAPVVYLKWHKMVYPGKKHPSIRKTTKVIKQLSSRDRREIYRISRMLPDEVVFHKSFQWTPEYSDLWASWLNSKELDLAIVFQ